MTSGKARAAAALAALAGRTGARERAAERRDDRTPEQRAEDRHRRLSDWHDNNAERRVRTRQETDR